MSDTFDTIKVEPERDHLGRYLIVPRDGGKARSYTRATTIADTLDDRYNLELYKIRMAMRGMAIDKSIYAQAASLPLPIRGDGNWERWKKLGKKAIEKAKEHDQAGLGEALHRFTERLNRGEDVRVPAPWDADIAAYNSALAKAGLIIDRRYLERIVVLEKEGIAGTFDNILNGHIADLKTGADLDFSWGAIAVQLAIYAHADTLYDPATKTHEAMPAVDQEKALVIHLPAGKATCTLYDVDIAAGWEAAQHALWTRNWRKRKNLAVPATKVGGGESAPVTHTPVEQAPSAVDTTPFEGGPADPVSVAALKARFMYLTPEQRAWISAIFKDAKAHKRSLSLAVGEPSQRKYWIGVGLIELAEAGCDNDVLEAALAVATSYGHPATGEHLSSMTCEQAARFAFAAQQLANGAALLYQDDGSVDVTAA